MDLDTYNHDRNHIRTFAKATMDDLMTDLTRFYGECPGDPQRNALHNIVWAMTCLADRRDYREDSIPKLSPSDGMRRPTFDLDCGTGKSRCVVSWCSTNAKSGFPFSVLILAEKIDELHSIYDQLRDKKIPANMLGVWHSDQRRKGPPIHSAEECEARPILLISHAKSERNPAWINLYKGRDRDLVVYDESLVVTQSLTLPVASTMNLLDEVRNEIEFKGKPETAEGSCEAERVVEDLSNAIRVEFRRQRREGNDAEPRKLKLSVKLVQADLDAIRTTLTVLKFNPEHIETLDALLATVRDGRAMRVWRDLDAAVISFALKVPKEYERVVVLDASFLLRKILRMDHSTLELPYAETEEETVAARFKRYSNVTVNLANCGSGKGTVGEEFGRRLKRGGGELAKRKPAGKITKLVVAAARQLPEDEACIIWTVKDHTSIGKRGGRWEVKQRDDLVHHLERAGIDVDSTLADDRPRFNFKTWGRHTADSTLSYCTHAIYAATYYLPQRAAVGLAVGQSNDLMMELKRGKVEEVINSEAMADLHQSFNRANMRKLDAQGEAGRTVIWLISHDAKEIVLRELVDTLMTDAKIVPWTLDGMLTEARLIKRRRLRQTLIDYASECAPGTKLWKGKRRGYETYLWQMAGLEEDSPQQRARLLDEVLKDAPTGWAEDSIVALIRG